MPPVTGRREASFGEADSRDAADLGEVVEIAAAGVARMREDWRVEVAALAS